ncbi:MAG: DUF1614 domain-containing protein [Methanosarcinales archaeon Met12]|nr:MAG: DUF1614 domain-containing protein [Methanosarcinales archaeon Met12]
MRGLINTPDCKAVALFGFILLPLVYLRYTGKLGPVLGLDSYLILATVAAMLLFSVFEIPIHRMRTRKPSYTGGEASLLGRLYSVPVEDELSTGAPRVYHTTITLNVGGFIIPLLLILGTRYNVPFLETVLVTMILAVSTHFLSKMEAGIGIIVPNYIGLASIPFAFILAPESIASVVLIGGVLGILIGLMTRLHPIEEGSAFINLGGVGSFRAICITVVLSLLLSFFA